MVAALPLILGAAGAATSAVGAISAGEAQGQAASYQAQVAKYNAQIASENARQASAAGSEQATIAGLRSANTVGRIKAQQGAGNIDVNAGSAVKVRAGAAEAGELDAATIEHNALLQAYGYRSAAVSDTGEAALLQSEANQAPIGADIGALGSLLGSASSLGFKWAGLQGDPASAPAPTGGGLGG